MNTTANTEASDARTNTQDVPIDDFDPFAEHIADFDDAMKEIRMPEAPKAGNGLPQIPLGSGLRKIKRDEGEPFNVAGADFTWKAKGVDTGYAFSLYEQDLASGDGVPLHCHAYGEVFYVLSGVVDFLRVSDAGEEWIECSGGETIIIPINALHALYNRTEDPARLLSISTQLHQAFFDAVEEADRTDPFALLPGPQGMARVGALARQFDMHFFSFSPPSPRR